MAFIVAAVFLIFFIANVALGAISGNAPMGNVAEMLVLFGAAIAFTAAILQREKAEKSASTKE